MFFLWFGFYRLLVYVFWWLVASDFRGSLLVTVLGSCGLPDKFNGAHYGSPSRCPAPTFQSMKTVDGVAICRPRWMVGALRQSIHWGGHRVRTLCDQKAPSDGHPEPPRTVVSFVRHPQASSGGPGSRYGTCDNSDLQVRSS